MVMVLYTGQSNDDIPRNVTRVKVVDPSVKAIGQEAFKGCKWLRNIELCDGLQQIEERAFGDCSSLDQIAIPSTVKSIDERAFEHCKQLRNVKFYEGMERFGDWAFQNCTSLASITIPSTVKVIGKGAFYQCSQMRNVELSEGMLESIHASTFLGCRSLQRISIPSTVKEIGDAAFAYCIQLTNVELREGLERIGGWVFFECRSLRRITIPSTVKYIHKKAFKYCHVLETIEFCEEIEQFVNEVSLPWWNHGVSKASLRTYSYLAQRNVAARLDTLKLQTWKSNIHEMLQRIPEELEDYEEEDDDDEEEDDSEGEEEDTNGDKFFDDIESRLANYEHLQDDVAPILELALWESKMSEQPNSKGVDAQMKLQCRFDSLTMVPIIIPNTLSFLSGDVYDSLLR